MGAKPTGQRLVRIPEENGTTFSDKTGPTNTNGLNHYFFFLSFLSSLIQAKNRFANNGTANFSWNILAEMSGPPPDVIPKIPVGKNRTNLSI